jgi:hypothetical protein
VDPTIKGLEDWWEPGAPVVAYHEVIERHDCVKAQEALDRVLNETARHPSP